MSVATRLADLRDGSVLVLRKRRRRYRRRVLSGRLHTRRRDRAAVAHHYDPSDDFYWPLLDDHMAYASAY